MNQVNEENQQDYMKQAIAVAFHNTQDKYGKPFGAVIVKDGHIIAIGINEVLATCDPTTHAEMQAIREACRTQQTSDLTGYELYASGHPCPMCLSAIYFANIQDVYYGYSECDGAEVGLGTQYVYDQLALPIEKRDIPLKKLDPGMSDLNPFVLWKVQQEQTKGNPFGDSGQSCSKRS